MRTIVPLTNGSTFAADGERVKTKTGAGSWSAATASMLVIDPNFKIECVDELSPLVHD